MFASCSDKCHMVKCHWPTHSEQVKTSVKTLLLKVKIRFYQNGTIGLVSSIQIR